MNESQTTQAEIDPGNRSEPTSEDVWCYRGYKLRPSEFTTAMVHYYRAEINRSNTWRNRLDATTNWAVVAAGAAISFALTSPGNHFGVIVLDTLLITLFCWIEARRYRYYELWSYRARLLETDFFGAMLVPPFAPHSDWAESLAESLLQPDFPVSMWEAFGRRLRRNYIWIFLILGFAWALKIFLHPVPAVTWADFIQRSAVGPVPGEAMIALGLLYNGLLFVIAMATAGLHQATGEVLPKYGEMNLLGGLREALEKNQQEGQGSFKDSFLHYRRHRRQLMTLVITDRPQEVADSVMKKMRRGVTGLAGQGMYTHQNREVLIIALTVTEVGELKALVKEIDPNAFMIVTPAQEILGRGFQALSPLEAYPAA